MARPIELTEALTAQIVEEFKQKIAGLRMTTGTLQFTKSFTFEKESAKNAQASIFFTPDAYIKMELLLSEFSTEIAWHALSKRIGDGEFLIYDILVYPQTVTGATVEMDEIKYAQWLDTLDDETFNAMNVQGHSHVNMATSPSGTDLNHQDEFIKDCGKPFYIFMIWNKRLEHNTKIFDIENNILYENADIAYGFLNEEDDYQEFIKKAQDMAPKKIVKPVTKTTVYTPASVSQPVKPATQNATQSTVKKFGNKSYDDACKNQPVDTFGEAWDEYDSYYGGYNRYFGDRYTR